jgi:hypothetical protein
MLLFMAHTSQLQRGETNASRAGLLAIFAAGILSFFFPNAMGGATIRPGRTIHQKGK